MCDNPSAHGSEPATLLRLPSSASHSANYTPFCCLNCGRAPSGGLDWALGYVIGTYSQRPSLSFITRLHAHAFYSTPPCGSSSTTHIRISLSTLNTNPRVSPIGKCGMAPQCEFDERFDPLPPIGQILLKASLGPPGFQSPLWSRSYRRRTLPATPTSDPSYLHSPSSRSPGPNSFMHHRTDASCASPR